MIFEIENKSKIKNQMKSKRLRKIFLFLNMILSETKESGAQGGEVQVCPLPFLLKSYFCERNWTSHQIQEQAKRQGLYRHAQKSSFHSAQQILK